MVTHQGRGPGTLRAFQPVDVSDRRQAQRENTNGQGHRSPGAAASQRPGHHEKETIVAFSINTNVASLEAQNYLRINSQFQNKTINEVTSGLRIVQSGDDAAGLAIANGYRSDEAVLTQGIQNANDGLSQLQIIDGGMSNISQLLDRARTLATQSASGTFTGDRNVLNGEFQSVIAEINRQSQSIGLNTGGTFAKALSVFVGGGQGTTGQAAIQNGSIALDLSQSTIDAKSLGLEGVQASGAAGTDIGAGSANTSVADILANAANQQQPGGYTDFIINGPGFSGANAMTLHVNLSGVTNSDTLATAINTAIQNAGNGVSQASTAFKNANVTASINTDSSGRQQLTFNSSNTAFQVAAGDQTANALLGNFGAKAAMTGTDASNSYTTTGATDDFLTLSFNGGPAMNFHIGVVSGVTAGTVAGNLNANAAFAANAVASTDSNHHLVITSLNDNSASSIAVTTTTLSQNLGLSGTANANASTGKSVSETLSVPAGATGTTSLAGAIVQFQGGGLTAPVSITLSAAATDYANAQTDLVNQAASNAALQDAGITVTAGAGGLTFSSNRGQNFSVSASGDVTNELGLGNYLLSGGSFDYTSITGTAIATGAQTDKLEISIAGGPAQAIQVTGAAGATAGTLAALVNAQIATNTALSAAGLQASAATASTITLTSNNGTYFRVAEGTGTAANQILGFGSGAVTNTLTASGDAGQQTSQASSATDNPYFNAGGSSASSVFPFNALRNGQDTQTVGISANDPSGNAHSLAVVLQNNATSRSGASLDQSIDAINQALQQSDDSTLQKIVAVKDAIVPSNGGTPTEGIRLISTLGSFSMSLGTAGTNGTAGIGAPADQGAVHNSTDLPGGGTADVSNQSSADAAVTALATAVTKLGTAQAVIGKGENQFSYAVNLAQSQVTNLAAAESSIRDADLAAESANLTKAQILIQAGVAALAQANSAPQQVLQLLK